MDGLIKTSEAAARLGVSRQTIENWGKSGVFDIHKGSGSSHTHYVSAKVIDAICGTAQQAERARQSLLQEQARLEAAREDVWRKRRDIERELYMHNKLSGGMSNRQFYLIIPAIMLGLGKLKPREADIMAKIIEGADTQDLANEYGLSRARIASIFYQGCRKCQCIEDIQKRIDECDRIEKELKEARDTIKNISARMLRALTDYQPQTSEMIRLLNTDIAACNFSTRTTNALIFQLRFKTVADIVKHSKRVLTTAMNFGPKCRGEVESFLEQHGLTFEMDVDAIYLNSAEHLLADH